MNEWKSYLDVGPRITKREGEPRARGLIRMRPYVPGEDLKNFTNGGAVFEGDFVGRHPDKYKNQWHITASAFDAYYKVAE